MSHTPAQIAAAVDRAKREILADALAGVFVDPPETFAQLHDYTDANLYGGLCDEDDTDAEYVLAWSSDDANTVQDTLDAWITSGALASAYIAGEVCTYDTGSMYGCEPACSRLASVVITYSGHGGPHRAPVCAQHRAATLSRIHPATYTEKEI